MSLKVVHYFKKKKKKERFSIEVVELYGLIVKSKFKNKYKQINQGFAAAVLFVGMREEMKMKLKLDY